MRAAKMESTRVQSYAQAGSSKYPAIHLHYLAYDGACKGGMVESPRLAFCERDEYSTGLILPPHMRLDSNAGRLVTAQRNYARQERWLQLH